MNVLVFDIETIPDLDGDEDDIEEGEVLEGDVTSEAPESDASDDAEE